VRKFLDPDNYATPFQEMALQHVSLTLRSEVNYEVIKPAPKKLIGNMEREFIAERQTGLQVKYW
jgi:hypothetical protein